jgi:DNA-directed RNA polymerase specialized sigma24 family protein
MRASDAGRAERFEALVREVGPSIAGYVVRRVEVHADAADVLSETLLVAWRRADALPQDAEGARRWLIGVARGVLANQRRTHLLACPGRAGGGADRRGPGGAARP